jgi:NADH-quinone oxidoreductase subunit A
MAMHSYPYIWNYLPLVLQVLVALGLAVGMVGASFFIGKHKNSRTKAGAYECGMDPIGDARGRFTVRFYMVAMLFILFDVEAVFMLPWAVIFRRCRRLRARACSASGRCWSISASSPWACFMSGRRAF